jgi:methylated-DNA-[protein]-cysteine S-methyltransferase
MPCALFPTRFGTCGIAWRDAALTSFHLPGEGRELNERSLAARAGEKPGEPPEWVRRVIDGVQRHLEGALQDFSGTPLDKSRATEFQMAVYAQAQAIKPGCTRSYGEIARNLSMGSEAARAVGLALAANPWPLIVPCHRVVSADGKMTGFSGPGGVRTKTRLLALEGAELLSD